MINTEQFFAFLEKATCSQAVIDGGDFTKHLRHQYALRARLHRAVTLQVHLVRLPLQFHHVHCELRCGGRLDSISMGRVTQYQVGQTEEYGEYDDRR